MKRHLLAASRHFIATARYKGHWHLDILAKRTGKRVTGSAWVKSKAQASELARPYLDRAEAERVVWRRNRLPGRHGEYSAERGRFSIIAERSTEGRSWQVVVIRDDKEPSHYAFIRGLRTLADAKRRGWDIAEQFTAGR